MAIVARFTGKKDADGMPVEYLGGVPARSLDEDEFKALTDEQQEAVKASSIYTMAGQKADAAPARAAAKDEGK